LLAQAGELGGLCPASQGAVKTELAFSVSLLEQSEELAPEEAAQHSDWKKEVLAARDPTRPRRGETAPGNHTMDMRMVMEVLSPGVKHGEEADLGTEMFGIGSDLEQGLGSGAQEKMVDNLLVLQSQRGQ
jgi:hypothetical protein